MISASLWKSATDSSDSSDSICARKAMNHVRSVMGAVVAAAATPACTHLDSNAGFLLARHETLGLALKNNAKVALAQLF